MPTFTTAKCEDCKKILMNENWQFCEKVYLVAEFGVVCHECYLNRESEGKEMKTRKEINEHIEKCEKQYLESDDYKDSFEYQRLEIRKAWLQFTKELDAHFRFTKFICWINKKLDIKK